MMDEQFLRQIARAMAAAGYSDRSKFIRDATYEKLVKLRIPVSYRLAMAPTRAGVIQVHSGRGYNYSLNEEPPKYRIKKKGKKK
jgi:metal-responsive CopG/Arc/MetJ family transcriptional regulator